MTNRARCSAEYSKRRWCEEYATRECPIDDDVFDADGEWRCPRVAVGDEGYDRCPFHLTPEERAEVGYSQDGLVERFVHEVNGDLDRIGGDLGGTDGRVYAVDLGDLPPEVAARRRREFLCARLGEFEVGGPDGEEIDPGNGAATEDGGIGATLNTGPGSGREGVSTDPTDMVEYGDEGRAGGEDGTDPESPKAIHFGAAEGHHVSFDGVETDLGLSLHGVQLSGGEDHPGLGIDGGRVGGIRMRAGSVTGREGIHLDGGTVRGDRAGIVVSEEATVQGERGLVVSSGGTVRGERGVVVSSGGRVDGGDRGVVVSSDGQVHGDGSGVVVDGATVGGNRGLVVSSGGRVEGSREGIAVSNEATIDGFDAGIAVSDEGAVRGGRRAILISGDTTVEGDSISGVYVSEHATIGGDWRGIVVSDAATVRGSRGVFVADGGTVRADWQGILVRSDGTLRGDRGLVVSDDGTVRGDLQAVLVDGGDVRGDRRGILVSAGTVRGDEIGVLVGEEGAVGRPAEDGHENGDANDADGDDGNADDGGADDRDGDDGDAGHEGILMVEAEMSTGGAVARIEGTLSSLGVDGGGDGLGSVSVSGGVVTDDVTIRGDARVDRVEFLGADVSEVRIAEESVVTDLSFRGSEDEAEQGAYVERDGRLDVRSVVVEGGGRVGRDLRVTDTDSGTRSVEDRPTGAVDVGDITCRNAEIGRNLVLERHAADGSDFHVSALRLGTSADRGDRPSSATVGGDVVCEDLRRGGRSGDGDGASTAAVGELILSDATVEGGVYALDSDLGEVELRAGTEVRKGMRLDGRRGGRTGDRDGTDGDEATVAGGLTLRNATVARNLRIERTEFGGDLTIGGTTETWPGPRGTTVGGSVTVEAVGLADSRIVFEDAAVDDGIALVDVKAAAVGCLRTDVGKGVSVAGDSDVAGQVRFGQDTTVDGDVALGDVASVHPTGTSGPGPDSGSGVPSDPDTGADPSEVRPALPDGDDPVADGGTERSVTVGALVCEDMTVRKDLVLNDVASTGTVASARSPHPDGTGGGAGTVTRTETVTGTVTRTESGSGTGTTGGPSASVAVHDTTVGGKVTVTDYRHDGTEPHGDGTPERTGHGDGTGNTSADADGSPDTVDGGGRSSDGIRIEETNVEEDVRIGPPGDEADVWGLDEGTYPVTTGGIALEDTIVDGKIVVRGTAVDGPIDVRECRVDESLRVGRQARGESGDDPSAVAVAVADAIRLEETPVTENVRFRDVRVGPRADTVDCANGDGRATARVGDGGETGWAPTTGDRDLRMVDSQVGGKITVENVAVDGTLAFDDLTRVGEGTTVDGRTRVTRLEADAVFERNLELRCTVDRSHLSGSDGDGRSGDPAGPGGGDATTTDAVAAVDLSGTTVESEAVLAPTVRGVTGTAARVSLRGATVPAGTLRVTAVRPAGSAESADGELSPAEAGRQRVWYDLQRATVGDVEVEVAGADDESVVDYLLFFNTDFDGFRFGKFTDDFEAVDWRLHDVAVADVSPADLLVHGDTVRDRRQDDGAGPVDSDGGDEMRTTGTAGRHGGRDPSARVGGVRRGGARILSGIGRSLRFLRRYPVGWLLLPVTDHRRDDLPPAALRRTYLMAKSGAREAGDEAAAGQLFVREKRYRREALRPTPLATAREVLEGTTSLRDAVGLPVRDSWEYCKNATFDAVAGYGEATSRIFGAVVSIWLLGAVAFGTLMATSGYEPYGESLGLVPQAILLSVESFITFTFTGPPGEVETLSAPMHAVAAAEGFLGVVFAALLVFTLTRSVHR